MHLLSNFLLFVFNFWKYYSNSSIFFMFYTIKLYLKKIKIWMIFLTSVAFRDIFSFNFIQLILCVPIFTVIWLNKKLFLINKVIEHNQVNRPCCKIKYLDLHPPHDFSDTYLVIVIDFLFYLLTEMILNLFN